MVATLILITMTRCIMFFPTLHAVGQGTELKSPSSPITNLTLNQKTLELTWDSSVNFTGYTCYMEINHVPISINVSSKTCFGIGQVKPIHKGALYRVNATYNHTSYSEEGRFIPQGMNGTSVENFSCVIYNISFMNCTWNVGRNAPEDTQYFLYLLYSKEEDELKCPHYIKDALGRHIACSFQDVRIVKEGVYFRVTGSSKKSEIQFYDENIQLYKIEKLTPPLNISVNCSKEPPECSVRWKRPHLSHSRGNIDFCFMYQINIQNKKTNANPKENRNECHTANSKESRNGCQTVEETNYRISNLKLKKKYIVQIRAKGQNCLISNNWGEWSEPIEIGNDADDAVLILEIVLLLIALGTLLVALVLFFLYKRYCSLKKLFSPVPQPRNKFDDLLQPSDKKTQMEWMDLPPTKYETEEITTVEEIK